VKNDWIHTYTPTLQMFRCA